MVSGDTCPKGPGYSVAIFLHLTQRRAFWGARIGLSYDDLLTPSLVARIDEEGHPHIRFIPYPPMSILRTRVQRLRGVFVSR